MLSLVIPTYGREQVLLDTVGALLALAVPADEILVIDQTPAHEPKTESQLKEWNNGGKIRWLSLSKPSIVTAMNHGLAEAKGDFVLFVDDDIIPSPQLIQSHVAAHQSHPDSWAVVGQVLQPGEVPIDIFNLEPDSTLNLFSGLTFCFASSKPGFTTNVMAGNLSVKRELALSIAGFDPNFIGVAYRFETDFARRILKAGGTIWYEPTASIRHLRAPSGGTRAYGHHLTSASPMHGVGDYYYALRHGRGFERFWYMLRRPFREVRTKYHFKHPWFIPIKLISEIRAMRLSYKIYRNT